jgi:hypothetical protein
MGISGRIALDGFAARCAASEKQYEEARRYRGASITTYDIPSRFRSTSTVRMDLGNGTSTGTNTWITRWGRVRSFLGIGLSR